MAYNKEKNDLILKKFLSLESEEEMYIQKQMDIAAQIDTYLKETGWTQNKLAGEAGLRPSQLSKIMAGEANPTLKTITNIEKALGKDIIVCPEFYEEELEEKGWIHPEKAIHLSAGAFRSEIFEGNNLVVVNTVYEGSLRVKRNQYSTAEQMHIQKSTGTHG
mgnify:CR=1 FL=1